MPIPPHVAALRALIGTAPMLLPGVSGAVLDDAGRVLLTRRADNGRWAIVSGILDPGEEPAAGIVREVAEETGVAAEVVRLTGVEAVGPITYPNGDVASYVDTCFLLRHSGGTARVADDENLEVAWFAPDALPENLLESSARRLAVALSGTAEAWFAR